MKLKEIKITNFRGFSSETCIAFDDLTVLIGKNDAGKSTFLDALAIYFNDTVPEKDDLCVFADTQDIIIACVFDDLPNKIVIDATYETDLNKEYLLRRDGKLEIVKVYNCTSAKPKITDTYAIAFSPTSPKYKDIHNLKISELKARVKELSIDTASINMSISSIIRHAIWSSAGDLELDNQKINLLPVQYGKDVAEQIKKHLPVFSLFKSDRASTDQDLEAQDPMKAAIKETIKQHESELTNLGNQISDELEKIASKTVEKIQEMDPELANQLTPIIKNKNWDSLFSVSLTGDDQIPINKRGSGTRRLILLNFFRAKAEEDAKSQDKGVIYAIEEPETSQHPNHQIMLINAFESLVSQGNCQVILTTHTPSLIRRLDQNSLRYIEKNGKIGMVRNCNDPSTLNMIQRSLGVLPDHDIKVFFGVEGKNDESFLCAISGILSKTEPDIPNLEHEIALNHLVFIPLGGSSLELWTSKLANLNRPEFYITDRDCEPPQKAHYQEQVDKWNERDNCVAWITSKRELENYIHPKAIHSECPNFPIDNILEFSNIPLIYAKANHENDPNSEKLWDNLEDDKKKSKINTAKKALNNRCVKQMTAELLTEIDTKQEIRTWLRLIGKKLNL